MMSSGRRISRHCSGLLLFVLIMLINRPCTYAVINSNPPAPAVDTRLPTPFNRQNNERSKPSIGPNGDRSSSRWEGSGANPDDEDGDVDEDGSGDGPGEEGSGAPPEEPKVPKGADVGRTISEGVLPPVVVVGGQGRGIAQYANTSTITHLQNLEFSSTTTTTPPPTTTTTTPPVLLATTLRPPRPTTTTAPKPTTTTTTTTTTMAPPKVRPKVPEAKWPPVLGTPPSFPGTTRSTKRPFFMADPTGTLDQLRPGIFAFMVGGAVVGLLLLILIISYVVYRLKKRDEGTYICEEPHQQAQYSYAYQKASIREFYA